MRRPAIPALRPDAGAYLKIGLTLAFYSWATRSPEREEHRRYLFETSTLQLHVLASSDIAKVISSKEKIP
jgi:hypothetical protein